MQTLSDQLASTERVLQETKGMWSQTEIEREHLEKLLDDRQEQSLAGLTTCSISCNTLCLEIVS